MSRPTEDQIRDLIHTRLDAMRARDTARVIGLGAADLTFFSLAPPLVDRGGPDDLARWFASWDGPIRFDSRDLTVVASDTAAYAHGLLHMQGSQTGTPVDLWLRETLGFRVIDGVWTLSHVHQSVPFRMDGSFRAATDLTP